MGNAGLNKWDFIGAAAGLITVGLTVLGAICSFKGSQQRNELLNSQYNKKN